MQNPFDPRTTTTGYDPAVSVGVPRAARDAGLRSYMLSVYNYMTSGILLTGIVALLFYNSGLAAQVMQTPLQWVIILAPLGFVFAMIFAHGPIILPGIMGLSVTPFSRLLYLWLSLLHISWLLRVLADLTLALEMRKISGAISAAAIVGYFATMAIITLRRKPAIC